MPVIFIIHNLTKVFSRGTIVTEDCDHTRPEHLQGGDMGREDTKRTGKRGHINLLHTGLFEEDLQMWDSRLKTHSPTYGLALQQFTNQM